MTFLAAFQALLHRLSAQQTVLVGTPVANRSRVELEPLVGLFANTLVMRADFDSDPSFSELLAQVRERALGAYSNQDLPYERLVEELAPPREASHNPVFQVMFAFQNADDGRLNLEGLSASQLDVENGTSKFDLTLDVYDLGSDRLQVEFEYSSDLFEPGTVARMAGQFERLLAGVVSDPSRTDQPAGAAVPGGGRERAAVEPRAPRRRASSGRCTRPWRTGCGARRTRRPCAGTAAS